MPKNGNTCECPLTDEIVAYIYREIGGRVELDFETHLADCTACTDEFAAVSNARFSVYEWKKDEFDHLSTPQFIIPYDVAEEKIGLAAAVRMWLGGLSFPVAAAAAIMTFVGIGLIAFGYFTTAEPETAVTPAAPVVQPQSVPETVLPFAANAPEPIENKRIMAIAVPVKAAVRPRRVVRRAVPDDRKPAENYAKRAPGLTPDQEPDDNSLRLADLFDELGG
jgi:hypothetical protein